MTPYGLDRWLDEEIARAHHRHARRHARLVLAVVVLLSAYLAYAAVTQRHQVPSPQRHTSVAVQAGRLGRPAPREESWVARGGLHSPWTEERLRAGGRPALMRAPRVVEQGLITPRGEVRLLGPQLPQTRHGARLQFASDSRGKTRRGPASVEPAFLSLGELHRCGSAASELGAESLRSKEGGGVCDRPRESETCSLASSAVVCIGVPAKATKSTAHDEEQQLRKIARTPGYSAGRLAVGCAWEPALGV
jgi:hypothetical protein